MSDALSGLAKGPLVSFAIGLLVTAVYAWHRFNEPTFSHQDTLPRTVAPLRYFFLRPAYRRARCTYTAVSLLVYASVVALGAPAIVSVLGIKREDFAPEALPLLVALILVGVVPNSNVQWLTKVEEELRRAVHKWFLVPDGVQKTVGILEDAHFAPPVSVLNAVPSPLRERIKEGLTLPRSSLRYRWARAAMLMESLRQMGAGNAHPLRRAAFEPFQEDFKAIKEKYQLLRQDVEPVGDGPISGEAEENLAASVDHLLTRIYAYISWGIRHQADSDRDVDQTLHELGFRVPPTNDRRLFDIVLPAIVLVVAITSTFAVLVDFVMRGKDIDETVVAAVSSAAAAGLMYGGVVWLALRGRANQIDQKVWRQGSSKCLVPIAFKAGFMTWGVIIGTTLVASMLGAAQPQQSLPGVFEPLLAKWLPAGTGEAPPSAPAWLVHTVKMGTAAPWALAGAVVGVVLCGLLGGDARRADKRRRMRDAAALGGWLALAAALAGLIQFSLNQQLGLGSAGQRPSNLQVLVEAALTGLAAFVCGAVIGYKVPQASKTDLEKPFDNTARRALGDLLSQAESDLGNKADAENWVFMPRDDLGGIAPAEAVRYRGHATGVKLLLEGEASSRRGEETRPDRVERPAPVVIEGGRSVG